MTNPSEHPPHAAPTPPAGKASRRPRREAPYPSASTLVRAMECVDAGERYARAGDRDRALASYGSAVDLYLQEGLLVLAASVAQRMVERYPDVVRARMTLAVLSLAEGLRVLSAGVIRNTCSTFQDYVHAAREAGQESVAIQQLRRFAENTESPAVRERIAECIHALGDTRGAEDVFLSAYEEREGIRAPGPPSGDQRTRWVDLLR